MTKEIIVNGEKVILNSGIPQISSKNELSYIVSTNSDTHEVFVHPDGGLSDGNSVDGLGIHIPTDRESIIEKYFSNTNRTSEGSKSNHQIVVKAPMPGLVKTIFVKFGDEVTKGAQLLILEAMKMENSIHAPNNGTISSVKTEIGDNVEKNQILIELS